MRGSGKSPVDALGCGEGPEHWGTPGRIESQDRVRWGRLQRESMTRPAERPLREPSEYVVSQVPEARKGPSVGNPGGAYQWP